MYKDSHNNEIFGNDLPAQSPQTMQQLLESISDSAIGQTYHECRDRLFHHHYPRKKASLYPHTDELSSEQLERVLLATEDQMYKSHNLILYMVWSRIDDHTRASVGLPKTLKSFCAMIGISTANVSQWRRKYDWLRQYLVMASRTGVDILNAVEDEIFTEMVTQAMNRENPNQLGWVKEINKVRGVYAPEKQEIGVSQIELDWGE